MIELKDLSPDQRKAYDRIVQWVEMQINDVGLGSESPVLSLGGYAGTGKSTLISLVAAQLDLPAYCAYTGKASSVLKRKLAAAGTQTVGTQKRDKQTGAASLDQRPYCGTIHSLIYCPCKCLEPASVDLEKPCPEENCPGETRWEESGSICAKDHKGLIPTKAAFDRLKPKQKFIRATKDASGRCTSCGGKGWLRRDILDRNYTAIIVDEASMVDNITLRDLKSFGVPILAVGDHGQLPPIGGSSTLMQNPDVRLERIHRQAEGNPIIALSKIIRETGQIPDSFNGGDKVLFDRLRFVDRIVEDRYHDASPTRLLEMAIVCYTNRRRVGLNVSVRRARGIARVGREPAIAGEHVVCLRNQKTPGKDPVFNGMRGVLMSDTKPKVHYNQNGKKISESETQVVGMIAFPEDGIESREYEMLCAQFNREKTYSEPEELARETGIRSFAMAGGLFDFGYAMTGHKLQGSQVEDLLMCAERPGPVDNETWKRWQYTVVTRAADKLTVLR